MLTNLMKFHNTILELFDISAISIGFWRTGFRRSTLADLANQLSKITNRFAPLVKN